MVKKNHLINRAWTNHKPTWDHGGGEIPPDPARVCRGFKIWKSQSLLYSVVRVWPVARCSLQDSSHRYLWWCLHFLSWTAPTRSDTEGLCWQVSQVLSRARGWRLVMNKEWRIHERFSRICPEILDSAFMSSAISSTFSHGWGWWWDSWHFC